MILYIYGSDNFRSRKYLEKTIGEFKKKRDPQGYNTVFLDSSQAELSLVLSEINSVPFLADKKMVILANILTLNDKELFDSLLKIVQQADQSKNPNVIVFWQSEPLSKIKEAKELNKALLKLKFVQKFDLLRGDQLYAWISQEFKQKDIKISHKAVEYLVLHAGSDMWFLASLVHQLGSYKPNQEIQVEDVQLFLDEKIDDNIFNMVEAIVSGQRSSALKLLNEQRRLGQDDNKLFGLINWQFRVLLELRDLFDRFDNLSSDEMAKQLGIHPFVAKKNLYLVKRYSMSKLKKLYDELTKMDWQFKTGQAQLKWLIDLLVVKNV